MAILPWYISETLKGQTDVSVFRVVRVVRLVRLFRLLKLKPFQVGVALISATLRESVKTLAVLFVLSVLAVLFYAILVLFSPCASSMRSWS